MINLDFFGTTGMLYIWGVIPLRHLLPVNSIATVKADFREGRWKEDIAKSWLYEQKPDIRRIQEDKLAKHSKVWKGNRNLYV